MKYFDPLAWMASFAVIICFTLTVMFSGCATASSPALTAAESAAWTAANTLLTTDQANGNVLTKAIISQALAATHNSGDAAVVDAAAALGEKLIQTQTAAKAAGASPTALQTITTTVLSDPAVIEAAANAISPTTMLKIYPVMDLRPPHGCIRQESAYDLSIAHN